MFKIGDLVWLSNFNQNRVSVICPDCYGTKILTVILGNSEKVTIPCVGCASGYEEPTGEITKYEYEAKAISRTVDSIHQETTTGGIEIEYHLLGGYCANEKDVFATEEEAIERAKQHKKKHEDEENKRFLAKTKDHRTWAWNVHYHRQKVKDLERELTYHKSKIEAIKFHVKEEKNTTHSDIAI